MRCPGFVKQTNKQGKQINKYSQVPCSFKEYEIVGSPQTGASPALMFKWDNYADDSNDISFWICTGAGSVGASTLLQQMYGLRRKNWSLLIIIITVIIIITMIIIVINLFIIIVFTCRSIRSSPLWPS